MATFIVIREAGTFATVDVMWEVTNPTTDLSVSRGSVTFVEGQQSASFQISAVPDDIPEANETYTIRLSGVSGDGRLADTATTATLVILQNDDPIRFSSSVSQVEEGDTAVFILERGGQANGESFVAATLVKETFFSSRHC